jgi:hypothetical protein
VWRSTPFQPFWRLKRKARQQLTNLVIYIINTTYHMDLKNISNGSSFNPRSPSAPFCLSPQGYKRPPPVTFLLRPARPCPAAPAFVSPLRPARRRPAATHPSLHPARCRRTGALALHPARRQPMPPFGFLLPDVACSLSPVGS